MTNKEKLAILAKEVAQLSATLRRLHHHAHILYWKHGAKLVKEGKSPEWAELAEALKMSEALMASTRLHKE
jgi:hypothetical protein